MALELGGRQRQLYIAAYLHRKQRFGDSSCELDWYARQMLSAPTHACKRKALWGVLGRTSI